MEVELKGTRGENSLSLLIQGVRIVGDRGESWAAVLFDTGARHSFENWLNSLCGLCLHRRTTLFAIERHTA